MTHHALPHLETAEMLEDQCIRKLVKGHFEGRHEGKLDSVACVQFGGKMMGLKEMCFLIVRSVSHQIVVNRCSKTLNSA